MALAPAPVVVTFAELRVPTERRLAAYSDGELQPVDTFLQHPSQALSDLASALLTMSRPVA